jgi:hypothetical protein
VDKKTQRTASGETVQFDITFVENPENEDNINTLGVLPFVFYSQELTPDYPTKSPLLDQAITFNALQSEYLTASNIQGTGQLVIKYPERMEGMFKKMTRGLLSAIKLPQSSSANDAPTDVQYINPNPDLAGQKEAVMTYMQAVMKEHGITSGSAVGTETFSSGLERAIANANVDDLIMKKQEQMVEVEKQVFEIVKTYERVVFNRPTFQEQDELMVVFRKPKVLMSDSETLMNIEKKMMLGLMSKAEALMVLDPNMTEEEAEDKLEEISEENLNILRGDNGRSEQNSQES